MKEIKLTQGKVALVDDEDFEYLNQWKWYAHFSKKTGLWYAERGIRVALNKLGNLGMHRVVTGMPNKNFDVDHRDRNGLNNQKGNLRVCNRTLNQGNSNKRKDNTSGFKGVNFHKGKKKFVSRIQFEKKRINLGCFLTPEEAALAYNLAAVKFFGEFARINNV